MEPDKKSNGAFIGAVIVIILIIVGAIYMWNKNNNAPQLNTSDQANTEVQVKEDATVLNAYEELNSLETDASSMDEDIKALDQTIQ